MGTISDKLTYLNTTKTQLKQMISYGYPLSNETFRQYVGGVFKALINSMSDTLNTTWNNLPKITTTPSTSQSINNTIEAPMRIELGASELSQTSTPTPSSPQDIHTISGNNTIRVCNKNLAKEYISGYPNGSVWATASTTKSIVSLVEPNTTYTIKKYAGNRFVIVESDTYPEAGTTVNSLYANSGVEGEQIATITTSSTAKYLTTFVSNQSLEPNVMVVKGTYTNDTMPTYEPYNGTDYSVDLGTDNYLPTSMAKMIANNTTGTWVGNEYSVNNLKIKVNDDLSFTVNGTASAQTTFLISNNETLKAGTYVLNGIDGGDIARMYMWDSSWANITNTTSSTEFTINEDKTIKVGVNLFNDKTFNNFKVEPMVSKKGGTYTPYGTTPLEYSKISTYEDKFIRNSGKNLFNRNNVVNVDNKILNDSGTEINDTGGGYTKMYIPVKSSTNYTISGLPSYATKRIYFFNSSKTFISRTSGYANVSEFTFTTPSNCKYIDIQYVTNGNDFNTYMLNEGTTALPYEPYGSNEWYIKKNIGKVVLDGTENWSGEGSLTNTIRVKLPMTYFPNSLGQLYTLHTLCNYFKFLVNYSTDSSHYYLGNTNDYAYFFIENTLANNVSEYKTWLGTHNTTVYYVLSTPTYTQITGTLAEQLEAIYNAMSKNGQTNLSQVNNDLGFVFDTGVLEDLS